MRLIHPEIPFKRPEKFSIKKCRVLLRKDGEDFTDEEIEKLRDFFYELGEIDYKNYINIRNRMQQQEEEKKKIKHSLFSY